jgi:serine/threonine protein kinase, bacterial
VSTLAGNGEEGFSGDRGKAVAAQLNVVHGAAQLTDGSFVLADMLNNRMRRVAHDGTISTVVGTGEGGYNGDGIPSAAAEINAPRGLAAMPDDGFVIADSVKPSRPPCPS